jgi:uncharacterized membrane protein
MVTVEELVNKGNSTVGFIVATLLVMSLQIVSLIPLIAVPLEPLMTTSVVLYPTNIPYIVAYFTIPLVFYICASLLLNPKRIISPLYAQIGTIAIITMMLAYRVATEPISTLNEMLTLIQSLVSTIVFWAMLLGEGGFVQLLVVRKVVGLSFDSVDRVSFLIEGKSPKDVIVLLGNSFINTYHFDKPFQRGTVWVIRRFDNRTKSSLIIAIGEQIGNSKNCIIATVAYHKGMYVINKSKASSDIRDEFFSNIKGKLLAIDPNIKVIRVPDEGLNDDTSTIAYVEARDVTISKLGIISEKARDIPLYYRVLIGGTLIALIGLVLAQLLNYGSFIELIAVVLIALGLEIGLPLRDELRDQLSKRKNGS